MPARRAESLDALRRGAGCEVVLVTAENLGDYIAPDQMHPAYPHLNLAHRSDYLRCWFMQRFGGGYSDIKPPGGDWSAAFDLVARRPDIWMAGYPEIGPGGIANLYDCAQVLGRPLPVQAGAWLRRKWIQAHWRGLIGICAFICRPDTPLTRAWWAGVNRRLDQLTPALRQHPARDPREKAGHVYDGVPSAYPVPWTHINGAILHPLMLKHRRHLAQAVPTPDFSDYLGAGER